ncbi:MAG: NYN domain-containing protein [Ectothiorhodospiraceae bacterium]|nr:NYN domain-containing protein [Ectothiorhodospiraceae bacterium]MCH8506165.1 NYN domain-containing protein [Ectothiorhodospiraceae bacterium]
MAGYRTAVGIYVDAANIQINGGFGMQYDVLREYACRGYGEPIRLNAYVTYDEERGKRDRQYATRANNFFSTIREFGYKVIIKQYKWYKDDEGNAYAKANADLDMAVDALLQSQSLGRVLLATGDGDFVQVVRALQNQGCRVEVLAFDNVSSDLRREADVYLSGYLVPNLLPTGRNGERPAWGEPGSRVRGICYHRNSDGFGFMRFLRRISDELWITDTRNPDSPYASVFFRDGDLPDGVRGTDLPSHKLLFEFDIQPSTVKEGGLQATNIRQVGQP